MSDTKVFLLDAHGICYRAFYAVKALVNSKGKPTNAVFGFCNILRKLIKDFQPTYMAACFDVGKVTLRQEKYADYKVQRQSMPEDLRSQIPIIYEVLKAYGIPIYEKEGYEADDVMATIAHQLSDRKAEVVIVSDDKDLSQLMSDRVHVYSARQEKILTDKDIEEKFGVPSSKIVDFLSLAGDSSDNIPGVDGVGQVSAVKLLSRYDSLKDIYKHIDEIAPAKLQEKLRVGKSQAELSHELATVDKNLPIKINLEDLKIKNSDTKQLLAIFTELEFRKFAQELNSDSSLVQSASKAPSEMLDPIRYLKLKEASQEVAVVYDLKDLCRKQQCPKEDKIFDLFLAQYLLAGGVNRGEFLKPGTEGEVIDLYKDFKKQIHEQQLDNLFYDVEIPLSRVLFEMESNGVQLDLKVLKKLSEECSKKMQALQETLHKEAGGEFNLNSPKQLSEILFERLKLPVIKKTKTGFSTDEEVLTKLADKHPIPALILEHRQLAKLKSTYLDALPELVDAQSRVHASFNQTGAETGRLSSNNPNLQNIPIRTELGKQIRRAFVAYEKGHRLLSADYSQIELRLLAHYCEDPNLVKAFKSDGDIHRYTASLMFDVKENKVDDTMRYAAKRINFGIIYGMSSFGLAKDLNVSMSQSQDFIDRYFLRYPKVREYMDHCIEQAKNDGFVETLFHRRRYLPDIKSANLGLRQFAQRQAINAPLQGTAADLIKIAMVRIADAIKAKKLSSVMIMTVHDELVFDILEKEQESMKDLVQHHMEHVMKLSVPLKADLKIGNNWLEMDKI